MDASSSGTAMSGAAAAPGSTGAGPAEVDADMIRQTYEAVLWGAPPPPVAERAHLNDLLLGHVQLLLPEVADNAVRMQGEQQRTAVHVIVRTRSLLAEGADKSPQAAASYARDLATQCRALLTLHQHPGLLDDRESYP
ncbi:DUF6415 family natural product biosynthesis protein [Streptomyces sp. RLA2-12]|uniref:DUF6415 family natural product biosynthesis protein n=1 Tax=Streptomyces sp. RLA2-12 TaxID=2721242 RepID=UPI00145FBEE3|nr:DUF6415 family natural product biosynthesis protein [Streptomyces sp. RLA2-12]NMI63181.1 hypothetical protein [Streptomyces sp. RLA2-12]